MKCIGTFILHKDYRINKDYPLNWRCGIIFMYFVQRVKWISDLFTYEYISKWSGWKISYITRSYLKDQHKYYGSVSVHGGYYFEEYPLQELYDA